MILKNKAKVVAMLAGLACFNVAADTTSHIDIAVIEGAKIFAEYLEDTPAIVNYFSQASEQDIIDFYQNRYGTANRTDTKRGRLTLYFTVDDSELRVIISKQGKSHQVDAMLK